jgi:riboflavin biosynthesis RibT protein
MLFRYKKTYEKIAMGLLSFVPSEKDLKKLQQTIKHYEDDDDWQLFLWKEEDIIGIVGIHTEGDVAELSHISVNPSYRNQGVGRRMVQALREMLGEKYELTSSKQSKEFFEKCLSQSDSELGENQD